MTTTEINPMRQKLIDYLDDFGLDAGEIPVDGWDSRGFRLYRPDADLDKIHPWPEGFDYDWFSRLANVAWMEDHRMYSV